MALNYTVILANLEESILAYETALSQLNTIGVEEYELRSGQSYQMVRRSDIKRLQDALAAMYQRHDALSQRAGLVAPLVARPVW
jgi:hypothetical protein